MNSYQMVLHRPVETAGVFGNFDCPGLQTDPPPALPNPPHPLDTPRIIKGRSRQNPPASGLCLPKLQRIHNSSVLKILQIISFVFKILQINRPVSGLFGILCTNRYPGGTPCRSQFQASTATRPATTSRPQPTSVAARPPSVIFLYMHCASAHAAGQLF
jgi:hypothetical protein